MYEINNEVINHLLFHKALIDDKQEHTTRINEYLKMVQQTQEGEHISMTDPFDRSIALAFELVLNNHFNPWSIDLVEFSTLYLKRAREEKINLITAGRIIYMAWRILRLQSDDLVLNIESNGKEEEPSDFNWGDLPTGAWLESDDGYSYTNLVMRMPNPILEEPLRRKAERKVTLMELLTAFDEARREAEEYQLLDKIRREEKERLKELAQKRMEGTAHEDHIEEDITAVWERIQEFRGKTITFSDLCSDNTLAERIKIFISILFLAYENKITVYQQRFPYGKIFIKNNGYT
ncbi:MAG: hypothetical protein QXS02_03975 [Candidatus Thermoplasmatota archaeon]